MTTAQVINTARRATARAIPPILSHALYFGGLGAVVYGLGLIYHPLWPIAGGLIAVWQGINIELERK